MSSLCVISPPHTRRRFSREFKTEMVAQCLKPGASVFRISLDSGLNANMVRRWITEVKRAGKTPSTTPALCRSICRRYLHPLTNRSAISEAIRIEIARSEGAVVVEWPAEQAHQCAALLRDLLG